MNIHFIGIGGIGISALARLALHKGHTVSGSDIASSAITKGLEKDGVKINIPHNKRAISNAQLVIHSAIVDASNEELLEAKRHNIPTLARKNAIKDLLSGYKVYSVCGAHGKSTTTAILASILQTNALIGAESKEFGSNAHFVGDDDKRLVFEADESDGSFVNSNPYCAIVTNAEPEHMENYNYDKEFFYKHYVDFLQKAKIRVINCTDDFLHSLDLDAIRLYSEDIQQIQLELINDEPYTSFVLKDLGRFKVWGFGEHIAIDASLAILAALNELDLETIRVNIKNYRGIKKRFDIVRSSNDFVAIDDYAHHPTEIKATIVSALNFAKLHNMDEIIAIWQPHKYSRTQDNIEEFKTCFKGVNKLVILPVWEPSNDKRDIDFAMHFAAYDPIFANNIDDVKHMLNRGLIIGFGAGDITHQIRTAL